MAVQEASAWCPVEDRQVLARRVTSSSGALDVVLLFLTLGLWLPVLILRSRDEANEPFRCAYCGTALRPRYTPGEGTRWEVARAPTPEERAERQRRRLIVAGAVGALVLTLALVYVIARATG